jgi:hypothetical protein
VRRRLIAVCRADPSGHYGWLPPLRQGDVTVVLDGLAQLDLQARRPLLFDELQSWTQRNAAEHHLAELLAAIGAHPAVVGGVAPNGGGVVGRGSGLFGFVESRLRSELALLLRGWTLAGAGEGARELVSDPDTPPALLMGIRAGLGLDPALVPYAAPPALAGSRLRRALARPLMGALAAASRPRGIRVLAVPAGKLVLALAALPRAELRASGVGVMPFPGLDHGNSALLALGHRLPLLGAFAPSFAPRRSAAGGAGINVPDRLGLLDPPALDRALALLLARLLAGVAPEFDRAVATLRALDRAPSLRALLLPSAGYGASRLLIDWAHARGVRVGAMQHGIYAFRESHGGDRWADLVFGWGERTARQVSGWPPPRPAVLPVGVPGTLPADPRPPAVTLRRALIATSNAMVTPLTPAALSEMFVEVLAPGLRRLAAAGVRLQLRPHPNEQPAHYRRLLAAHGLEIEIAPNAVPFAAAAAEVDIVISSASSVAFEAGALGVPVLMWLGDSPRWVREEQLLPPWTQSIPGTFERAEDFSSLADLFVERPAQAFALADRLARHLAGFAEPFRADRFAAAIHALAHEADS